MNECCQEFGDLSCACKGEREQVCDVQAAEMSLDVIDLPSKILIQGFLAGVLPADLRVAICSDGVLSIEAVRRPCDDYEDQDYLISECFYGNLTREVVLPLNLDYESMHAQLYQGVLKIEIAKLNLEQ